MQIAHNQPIPQPNIQIFLDLKDNKPFPQLAIIEAYYYCKAHKLVAPIHFNSYWTDGKSKQPLIDILDAHSPPLTYCHNQQDGYIGLDDYVELAKGIFQ